MASKVKIVETVLIFGQEPIVKVLKNNLPLSKGLKMLERLEDKLSSSDFDPDRMVSYSVKSA
jgi:hypothetical protein